MRRVSDIAREPVRDVGLAVAVKLALLAAIYLLFFAPDGRKPVDDAAVAGHLLQTAPAR